jgi:hypothetical protein
MIVDGPYGCPRCGQMTSFCIGSAMRIASESQQ